MSPRSSAVLVPEQDTRSLIDKAEVVVFSFLTNVHKILGVEIVYTVRVE